MTDKDGNALISGGPDFVLDATVWENRDDGASPPDGLFFSGPNAMAANGEQPVGLYTPSTFRFGTSVTHIDDQNTTFDPDNNRINFLMFAQQPTGLQTRALHPIEIGIMQDLGYDMKLPRLVTPPDDILLFGNTTGGFNGRNQSLTDFLTGARATDPAGNPTITNNAPAFFLLGDTTVTFTATYSDNEQVTATAKVTVLDLEARTLTVEPLSATFEATSGNSTSVTTSVTVTELAVDLTINNASFESPVFVTGGNLHVTEWFEEAGNDTSFLGGYVVPEDAAAGWPAPPAGSQWLELISNPGVPGSVYQPIGTAPPNTPLAVSLVIGSRDHNCCGDSKLVVELWAGGDPDAAANGTKLQDISGATKVDSKILANPGGMRTRADAFVLNTGASGDGPLWLRLTQVGSDDTVDSLGTNDLVLIDDLTIGGLAGHAEVTTTADGYNFSDDEVTLREAIFAANGPSDTITFPPAARGTITLTMGRLDVTDHLTIIGPGADFLTIDGDDKLGILQVLDDKSTLLNVSVSGLTFTLPTARFPETRLRVTVAASLCPPVLAQTRPK